MRLTKMPITQLYIIVSIFVVTLLFLSYLFFKRKHKKEKKEKADYFIRSYDEIQAKTYERCGV